QPSTLNPQPQVHEFKTASGGTIRLKVGVHCGPATAAVVGRHKRFFCLFGDVINTAARSESRASQRVLFSQRVARHCEGDSPREPPSLTARP
ncbi:hypothetical protein T484DRAFT_1612549, partial [Baffinella frigidus]